ncbi:TauD/TfdA family dioxygenase [Amycolatopsis eburnea]|uniref:TauD/TfdA-like domain-containing protein n=1 Tax=Amycolatopsis eburnea TaxID=2267691 RepID=A0A3R9FLT7_9PSEU|nr:TauD/TfdA family dioxygenase [Amycolatopsis eburnea]RSD16357.1 hypothetical protein EIY87_22150 [Amycolatopsis eburnea]
MTTDAALSVLSQATYSDTELDLDRVHAALSSVGYVYITDVPEGFDYVAQLSRLGPPSPQFDGVTVREVRPEPGIDNTVYSASNTRELLPHTEWFEYPGLPPRYVSLWCLQPADGPGGETTLADSHALMRELAPDHVEHLATKVYPWRPSAALERFGVSFSAQHPLVVEHEHGRLVRFPCDDRCSAFDEPMGRYLELGRSFFERNHIAIRIEKNAILVWDNWRMMHARNAFTDQRRHLRRLLIADC